MEGAAEGRTSMKRWARSCQWKNCLLKLCESPASPNEERSAHESALQFREWSPVCFGEGADSGADGHHLHGNKKGRNRGCTVADQVTSLTTLDEIKARRPETLVEQKTVESQQSIGASRAHDLRGGCSASFWTKTSSHSVWPITRFRVSVRPHCIRTHQATHMRWGDC